MTKRLIDIDDRLLSEATSALGSSTMKDTVTEALKLAIHTKATREHLETLASPRFADLRDEQIMRGAWR